MIETIPDLVAFLKQFHRHRLDDPSIDPARIPADLPPGLAMLYRELGALVEIKEGPGHHRRAPFAAQDALLPVGRLKRVGGMIEFAWENQGNWSARFPIGPPDPPVYSDAADLRTAEPNGFVVVCKSLDHFLITLSLQEAVMGCRNLISLKTDRPPDRAIAIPLQPLWLDGYYVSDEPDHQIYATPDRDVLVMDWGGLWVGSIARDPAGLIVSGDGYQVIF